MRETSNDKHDTLKQGAIRDNLHGSKLRISSPKRKCLECDYIFPEDSIRTYCNNCEPRITNTERKKVTVRPTQKSLKLRNSNTKRQDDRLERMTKRNKTIKDGLAKITKNKRLNDFSEIMDLYFNERLFLYGYGDAKLVGFTSQFFDRLESFFDINYTPKLINDAPSHYPKEEK